MSDLFLDSLEVHNFRAFRELKIPQLGRVNLFGNSYKQRY